MSVCYDNEVIITGYKGDPYLSLKFNLDKDFLLAYENPNDPIKHYPYLHIFICTVNKNIGIKLCL